MSPNIEVSMSSITKIELYTLVRKWLARDDLARPYVRPLRTAAAATPGFDWEIKRVIKKA